MLSKPALIEDWKCKIWRSWTVRLSALSAAIQGIFVAWPTALQDMYAALPDDLKAFLPHRIGMFIPLALTLAAIAVRPILQRKMNNGDK